VGPTERLMQEHEVIVKGLAVLRRMADRLARGAPVAPEAAAGLLDFFVGFADQQHHLKEETLLFPALVEAGLPAQGGPVGVMLHEHEIGRALLARLRKAVPDLDKPGPARGDFVDAAMNYCVLLGDHIDKENGILFRLADQALSREQVRRLEDEFERLEEGGRERREQHARALDELERTFAIPAG